MHKYHTQEKYPNLLGATRRMKGYRYKQVARRLRMKSTKTISQWERGIRMPGGKNLIALSLLFGKPIEKLYPVLVAQIREQLET